MKRLAYSTKFSHVGAYYDMHPKGICARCGTNRATEWWCPDGVTAFVHGMAAPWCMRCVLEEQLKAARESAARVPELEQQLAQMGGPMGGA